MTVSMVPCPHCGTPQSPNVPRCSACGGSLGVMPTADEPRRNLASTQIAGTAPSLPDHLPAPSAAAAPGAPPSAERGGAASGGTFKKTMLGMPNFALPDPVAAASPAAPEPSVPRPHNKTRLGVGPMPSPPGRPLQTLVQAPSAPSAGGTPSGALSPDALPPDAQPQNVPPAESEAGFKRTMLGVAPPEMLQQLSGLPGMTLPLAPAAGQDSRVPGVKSTQMQFSPVAPVPGLPNTFNPAGTLPLANDGSIPLPPVNPVPVAKDSHQKTVLGVAVPGIAPIRPGQAKPPPAPPVAAV